MKHRSLLALTAALGAAVFLSPRAWAQGSLADLGTLGGTNSNTTGINAAGQVVGWSDTTVVDPTFGGYEQHAFLWKPKKANGTTGTMIDLGTLGGGFSLADAVNDAGQVVGIANTLSGSFAFLWTPDRPNGATGAMISLGTLGGFPSEAYAINAAGQVAGGSWNSPDTNTAQFHAFVWTSGGTDGVADNPQMKDIGTLGGTLSIARGINGSGRVVGLAGIAGDAALHAFLWTSGGTDGVTDNPQMKDLGTLGGSSSYAYGINTAGQVVGYSSLPGDPTDATGNLIYHAFVWTSGGTDGVAGNPQMKDLGTLGGSSSFAAGINDAGAVSGGSSLTGDPIDASTGYLVSHAFVWTPTVPNGTTGAMTDAGTLGGTSANAVGINAAGQLAGASSLTGDPIDTSGPFPGPIQHAFVSAAPRGGGGGTANRVPVARNDAATLAAAQTAVTIDVLANDRDPDGDALTITSVTQPTYGATSLVGTQVRYDATGTRPKRGTKDTFTYAIGDGKGGRATASVTVTYK